MKKREKIIYFYVITISLLLLIQPRLIAFAGNDQVISNAIVEVENNQEKETTKSTNSKNNSSINTKLPQTGSSLFFETFYQLTGLIVLLISYQIWKNTLTTRRKYEKI